MRNMDLYTKIKLLTEQGNIRIQQLQRRNAIYGTLHERCRQCPNEFSEFMLLMDKLHLEQSKNMYSKGVWHCISSVPDTLHETDILLDRLETLTNDNNICQNIRNCVSF